MRNSNLLPVKAKGEVLLRSVVSRLNFGSTSTPSFHLRLLRFPVWGVVFNRLEYRIQFVSEKDGNHSGRRFIRSQPVIVSRGGYGNAQQILIIVHRLDYRAQKQEELGVFIRSLSGRKQILTRIGSDGPVIVFAALPFTQRKVFHGADTRGRVWPPPSA